jgi:hypothetical protein
MNVVTIESEAYQDIIEKLDSLSKLIDTHQNSIDPDKAWVDNDDVCSFLRISHRTLQRLRSKGSITYSTLGGKKYYTISEIKRVLEERKVRTNVQSIDELCEVYRKRIDNIQKKHPKQNE